MILTFCFSKKSLSYYNAINYSQMKSSRKFFQSALSFKPMTPSSIVSYALTTSRCRIRISSELFEMSFIILFADAQAQVWMAQLNPPSKRFKKHFYYYSTCGNAGSIRKHVNSSDRSSGTPTHHQIFFQIYPSVYSPITECFEHQTHRCRFAHPVSLRTMYISYIFLRGCVCETGT